jgi:hypothetical protein
VELSSTIPASGYAKSQSAAENSRICVSYSYMAEVKHDYAGSQIDNAEEVVRED